MPESSPPPAEDRFGGRTPTSHERMSGRPWDASYTDGPAPWDFGGPQPAFERLVERVAIAGPVLDAGCGSGENALLVAALGVPVVGVDVAETALALARGQAEQRKIAAEFIACDALDLQQLGRTFATVLDSGLFHTFDAEERARYVASLAGVTNPGARLYVLAFSDRGSDVGPHPVSEEAFRTAFSADTGWAILSLEPDRVRTRFHDENGAPAWFATIERRTGRWIQSPSGASPHKAARLS